MLFFLQRHSLIIQKNCGARLRQNTRLQENCGAGWDSIKLNFVHSPSKNSTGCQQLPSPPGVAWCRRIFDSEYFHRFNEIVAAPPGGLYHPRRPGEREAGIGGWPVTGGPRGGRWFSPTKSGYECKIALGASARRVRDECGPSAVWWTRVQLPARTFSGKSNSFYLLAGWSCDRLYLCNFLESKPIPLNTSSIFIVAIS